MASFYKSTQDRSSSDPLGCSGIPTCMEGGRPKRHDRAAKYTKGGDLIKSKRCTEYTYMSLPLAKLTSSVFLGSTQGSIT